MNRSVALILLAIIFIPVFFFCLKAGSIEMSWREFAEELVAMNSESRLGMILFKLRLPRVILACLAGAALSISGLVFQALLRNPLAEPYVLGISGGAAAGAMVGIVAGFGGTYLGIPAPPVFAFCGALLTILFVYSFARRRGDALPVHTLLLAGIALQAMLSALILFVQSVMDPMEMARAFVMITGRIPSLPVETLSFLAAAAALGIALIVPLGRSLNAISLGDDTALSVGVNVRRVKKIVFFTSSLMTGVFVSFTGLIGFVGIIVPHIARIFFGSDHRRLIPASIIGGAIFLMISDTIARTLVLPGELPVGLVTALVGGPFFLFLLGIGGRSR